jgi:hypothetical protein
VANRESKTTSKPSYSILAEIVSYVPISTLKELLTVYKYGEQKYDKDNWRTPPYLSLTEVTDSLLRHLFARLNGETHDVESKLLHSTHLLWNAVTLVEYELQGWFDVKAETDTQNTAFSDLIAKLKQKREEKAAFTQPIEQPINYDEPSQVNLDDFTEFFDDDDEI